MANIKELFDQWFIGGHPASPRRVSGLTRRQLLKHFGNYGLRIGAEIGVDRGRFSEYMLTHIPGSRILVVDPWHWKLRGEARYESTVKRLAPYGDRVTIVRATSLEAVKDVPDNSLDFCYIDGDHHLEMISADLEAWAPKVRLGGVLCGHDYYYFQIHGIGAGVIDAVNLFTLQHGVGQWFLTDERTPTWFWVREL